LGGLAAAKIRAFLANWLVIFLTEQNNSKKHQISEKS
jgi:hypothetical protein